MQALLPRRPLRCILLGALAFLSNAGPFSAAAQALKPSPGVDGLCESMGVWGGMPAIPMPELRYPAWNLARFNPADNRQIAALRSELDSSGFLHRHLYVLNQATRRRKLLVRDVGCALTWGRTGWLVLERGGQLWRIRASGDSLTRLLPAAAPNTHPAWSPSGRLLACLQAKTTSVGAPATDIVLLAPNGRLVRRLFLGNVYVGAAPTWSPDGRKLAFRGSDDRAVNLYEYDLATNRLRVVFAFLGYQASAWHSVHWRGNGQEIVWRASNEGLAVINPALRSKRPTWRGVYLLSLDLDATGRRGLMVSAEGHLVNPRDRSRGEYYMEAELFTANLDGSRRIAIK